MRNERLTAVDTAYVRMETPRTPMHTARLLIFRLPPGEGETWVESLVAEMRRTPPRSGLYVRRLAETGRWRRNYRWVRDEAIDLDHHVRYWRLPDPGGDAELRGVLHKAFTPALDMKRPLWECHVFGNLAGGRFALLLKTHHAAQDGFGATGYLRRWLSEDSGHGGLAGPWGLDEPDNAASTVPITHARRSWIPRGSGKARRPFRQRVPGTQLWTWAESLCVRRRARRAQSSNPGGGLLLAMAVPQTPLNRRLSSERNFAHCTFDLRRFRAIGERAEATVNEVAMTVIGGALRSYLTERGALPERPLVASVPVGLPRTDGKTGNAGTALFCTLGTDHADAAVRLAAVTAGSRYAKAALTELPTDIVEQLTASATWRLHSGQMLHLSRWRKPFFNVAISNGIYGHKPLYFRGAVLELSHPCSVVFDGHALNITIVGYVDRLTMAFSGCPTATPDLDRLAALTEEALAALEAALGTGRHFEEAERMATPVPLVIEARKAG